MNRMEEGRDYKMVTHDPSYEGPAQIILLRKPYKDVIIEFGKLSIGREENPDGTINANFDYDFVDMKGKDAKVFETDSFRNYLGDILFSILEDNLNENNLEQVNPEEYMNEFREDVVEEPDLERRVRTKNSTVRKR